MTAVIMPPGGRLQEVPACPYMGLRSYTEADSDYFFARDSDRDLVVSNLMASRLTVLYGPSGVGKSSLLQAGVLPLLRRTSEGAFSYLALDDAVVVYFDTWQDKPLAELGAALLRSVPKPEAVRDLVADKRPLSLELLQEVTTRLGADIYLLLDQFEELALYQTGGEGKAIDVELGRIITAPDLSVSVLLGVRDDALAKLDRLKAHVPRIFDKNLRLHHLSRSGAQEAIEQPLIKYSASVPPDRQISIEPELVEELLTQLQKGSVPVAEGGNGVIAGSESISTPYLQLVMTRLWEAEDQDPRLLRLETLRRLGGTKQIVSTHLDTVMAGLTETQRETAAAVFRYLVTPSQMKIAYNADDLADVARVEPSRVRELLERLASGRERVLRPVPPPVGSDGPPRYEIFHDVMAPAVLDWRSCYIAGREQQRHRAIRRRLHRSRILSAALAFLLIVAGVGWWMALQADSKARRASLLAQYGELLGIDPAESLNAALRAWRINDKDPAARTAIRIAFDADNELLRLPADPRMAWTSQFSPDGKAVLTTGADGVAKTFDATTGQPLQTFQPSGAPERPELKEASFSPDRRFILTVTKTGDLRLFNADTAADLGLLTQAGSLLQAVWGSLGDRPVLLVSDWTGPPKLWDVRSRTVVATYGTAGAGHAAFSRDGRYVVAAEMTTSRVSVWNAGTRRLLGRSKPLGAYAASARFAGTDSGRIALYVEQTDTSRWHLKFWDWRKGPGAFQSVAAESRVPAFLAVSKDGRSVAAALDKRVRVFDADTLEQVAETPEAPDWVNVAVSFSADGRWLATTGDDGRARVWSARGDNNRPVAELLGHGARVDDVEFDPHDPWRLTTAGYDGTARVWQLPAHTVLTGSGDWMRGASISSDGQYLVAAENNGWLGVYNLPADAPRKPQPKATRVDRVGQLQGASFTSDGRMVVAAGAYSHAPMVWDWQHSGNPFELDPGDNYIRSFAVNEDGRQVAAGDTQGQLLVWDLASQKIIHTMREGRDSFEVTAVTAVPHSGWFAVATRDGMIRLWDPDRPGAPRQRLGSAGDSPVRSVDVTSDGSYLVSVAENHRVQVWRLSDGKRVRSLNGPSSTNTDVAFSQDGNLLAISAGDAAVHVWQWRSGLKVAVLHRHGDLVNTVEFTPDGKLLTASADSTVAIFACTTCGPFDGLRVNAERRADKRR
jgi:WD40 repeat protein